MNNALFQQNQAATQAIAQPQQMLQQQAGPNPHPNAHAAQVAAHGHGHGHGHGSASHRVFKLQFDARKIICCSQDPRIVVWDFANGDREIEDTSQFFVGPA